MKNTFHIFLFTIILFIFANELFAQSGMRFPELSKKLEPYFADELIDDIRAELPENDNFSIWGWDVGDFSGDGFNDLALSVKFLRDKRKIVQVYLFTDNDGFLSKIGQFAYEYFELPLEIGVSIKENTCYVTKKRKQFDWVIKGYRFENGVLVLLDNFETARIEQYTLEQYTNYQTCESKLKYILTKNNNTAYETNYFSVPSYERGRIVYKGYSNSVSADNPEFVYDGAFYHKGETDASYNIKSSYDEENLYFIINLNDDEVIPTRTDSSLGDDIELVFDFYPFLFDKNRIVKDYKGKNIELRSKADTGIYSIVISPGDFLEKSPYVKSIKSTDEVNEDQKFAVNRIKIVSSLHRTGYQLKIKIPFDVFGINLYPTEEDEAIRIGFSFVMNDVDNEFRAEEISHISNSKFERNNPASFGELILIPAAQWYGESYNVFHDDIINTLNGNGF